MTGRPEWSLCQIAADSLRKVHFRDDRLREDPAQSASP